MPLWSPYLARVNTSSAPETGLSQAPPYLLPCPVLIYCGRRRVATPGCPFQERVVPTGSCRLTISSQSRTHGSLTPGPHSFPSQALTPHTHCALQMLSQRWVPGSNAGVKPRASTQCLNHSSHTAHHSVCSRLDSE